MENGGFKRTKMNAERTEKGRFRKLYLNTKAEVRDRFQVEFNKEVDFKCTWAMEWPHMDVNPDIYERLGLSGEKLTYAHHCDHLASTLTIRWNGDVVPCCYDLTSEFVVGNISDMDLFSIWNNSRFNEIRIAIRDGQPLPLCAKCNVIRRSGVYLAIRPGVLARLG